MPPHPSSSSSSPSATAPKGVEFSDHLIVLGAASESSSVPPPPPPPPPPPLPKARVFVKRPPISPRPPLPSPERAASPYVEAPVAHQLRPPPPPAPSSSTLSPSSPPHIAPPTETRIPPDEVVLRPPDRRRARFFHTAPQLGDLSALSELREPDHASDSDSENETIQSTRMSSVHVLDLDEQDLARCTRINTKLNSLPSGGAFSFLNSSEDVDTCSTSSSSSCSSDERLRESRKMIRVDGSAKLSTASGVLDSSDEEDDHEFSIEGAESVEEEEAVQVRSFGRTLAKATLGPEDGAENAALGTELHKIEANSTPDRERVVKPSGPNGANLTVSKAHSSNALREHILRGPAVGANEANAGGNRKRRSRLRVTFMRRNSGKSSVRTDTTGSQMLDDEDYVEQRTGSFSAISCFSVRRTTACRSRLRGMTSGKENGERGAAEEGRRRRKGRSAKTCRDVVVAPDFEEGAASRRGMVKNVSLQRDDFIDFTTNGGGSCGTGRGTWLARLVSLGDGCSVSDEESVAGGGDGNGGGRGRRWKLFGRR